MGAAPKKGKRLQTLEDLLDQVDVPAAVVCAICGEAECPGCERDDASRSGVISIIAWERRDGSMLRRLWLTARATTRDPESFFEALPDGPIAPALGFALTSEMLASSAMIFTLLPICAFVAPLWAREMLFDAGSRVVAVRVLCVAIPALAVMLVMAHAAHGLALDVGARRSGGRAARTRALRFGLYATGWDLIIGPLGALVVALTEGVSSAASLARIGIGLPGRSARAFLRGTYLLYGKSADYAMRLSYVSAVIVSLMVALMILATIVALILA
jgi:hypothetical protein